MKVSNPQDTKETFKPIKLLIELETMEDVKGFYNIFNCSYITDTSGIEYTGIIDRIREDYLEFDFCTEFDIFITKLKESIPRNK